MPLATRPSIATLATAALLDIAVVLAFVIIGRSSHTEGLTLSGIAGTAWPFLVGALIGWLAGRVWSRPLRLRSSGIAVWLGTLVGGMVLRVISGQGTELTFILVAAAFLALFLLGWRALALLITARRRPVSA